MSKIETKICGLTTPETAKAAIQAGAVYIGLVFYPRSPRFVSDRMAREIALDTPRAVKRIGLFVDPTDDDLDATLSEVPLDMLQLHGAETPERVREIKALYRHPVIKAFRIAEPSDLDAIAAYESIADMLLFDAPPPAGSGLPGGNGVTFDWGLLKGRTWRRPWMLSGGLNPDNVGEAIRISGASAVDVSSGVEVRPGLKDPALVQAFIAATLRP